jgi:hypothetical protein
LITAPNGDVKAPAGPGVLAGVVMGLAAAICLMLLAFSAPTIHSGPHDLPLALSGPGPAVTRLYTTLREKNPGAFEVTTYATADEVTAAIKHRDAVGGVSIASDRGVTVQTASAAGAPYASLLRNIGSALADSGLAVTYTDVAPLTSDDPAGTGLAALALPLAFGGTASAVILATLFPRSRTLCVVGSVIFSVLAGLAATAILQYWLGAIDGPFWATAAGVGVGIAAISLTVLGLESLLGYAGAGLGALMMVFIANPLSGIATGPAWLPQPWGDIGQFLPIGAAGTVIRSAAFFDGAGSGRALLVLAAWIVLGLILVALSTRRESRPAPTARHRNSDRNIASSLNRSEP